MDDGTAEEEWIEWGTDGGCFGCSTSNPAGLRLRFRRRGATVLSDCVIAEHFHGAPGIVHGGIIATLLDEVSCVAAWVKQAGHVVTGEISVRYRRPCPVEVPLTLSAQIVDQHARYLVIKAELRRADELLADSTGKFFPTA